MVISELLSYFAEQSFGFDPTNAFKMVKPESTGHKSAEHGGCALK